MRILVVSDIHANEPALRAVWQAEEPDAVLCVGDLVDYGPDPAPCVAWTRNHAMAAVRGNHDDALVRRIRCRCARALQGLTDDTQELARQALGPDEIAWLRSLPLQTDIALGGVRFRLVHAAPADPLFTYLGPEETAAWTRAVEGVEADIVLVGHTHLPMVLRLGGKLVVNPGSVGQPRDGDPRAAYAVIEDGVPRLGRATYDIEETVRRLAECGLAPGVVEALERVLRTGGATGGHSPPSTGTGRESTGARE